jgi:hypothetical protein
VANIVATFIERKDNEMQSDRVFSTKEGGPNPSRQGSNLAPRSLHGTISPGLQLSTAQAKEAFNLEKRALNHLMRIETLRRQCPMVDIQVPVQVRCEVLPANWTVVGAGARARLQQTLTRRGAYPLQRPFNPWSMSADFFKLRRGNLEALVAFLEKYGQFSDDPPEDPEEYWQVQDDLRDILLDKGFYYGFLRDKIDRLFKQPYAVTFPWSSYEKVWTGRGKPKKTLLPRLTINVSCCLEALRLSVEIDMVRGVKFRQCARKDCCAPYTVETRHKRKYCTQYCAHLASVRRSAVKATSGKKSGSIRRRVKGSDRPV